MQFEQRAKQTNEVNMRQIVLLALIAAAFWNAPAWSFNCGEIALLSTTKDDGTEIGIYISDQQLEPTPEWSPGSGEPPLGVTEAIEIAIQWAEKEYARYDSVEIHGIDLQEVGCSRAKNHWYYMFHFRPVIDGNRLWGSGNFAAVLMDGTVIGPKEKP